MRTGKAMSTTATKYLTALATEGVTAAKITTLNTQRDALDVAIDAQAKGISDRDVATEDRIEALNNLYRLLTNTLAPDKISSTKPTKPSTTITSSTTHRMGYQTTRLHQHRHCNL